jgi:hypothetical protein
LAAVVLALLLRHKDPTDLTAFSAALPPQAAVAAEPTTPQQTGVLAVPVVVAREKVFQLEVPLPLQAKAMQAALVIQP